MDEMEFNLLDEPWIRALDINGVSSRYSLKGIFENAHNIRELSGELPTQDFAIMRLLISIVHAVYQDHDMNGDMCTIEDSDDACAHWGKIWSKGVFDMGHIGAYLESYRDRFYLFHPTRPFFQAPIKTGSSYSTSKLNGETSESENKPRLFSPMSGPSKKVMTYDEAARWLLQLSMFDDTSSKVKTRSISIQVGWLGRIGPVYIRGRNLFQTILFNSVFASNNGDVFPPGVPTWEPEVAIADDRIEIPVPTSQVELLTHQSRRILLLRENGAVVGYRVMGGDIFSGGNMLIEQMTAWIQTKDGEYRPHCHNHARSMWRDFQALIACSYRDSVSRRPGVVDWFDRLVEVGILDEEYLIMQIVGVTYDSNRSSITHYIADHLSLNADLLRAMDSGWNVRISEVIKLTDECVYELGRFAGSVSDINGCDEGIVKRTLSDVKARAYYDLDIPFRRWLGAIIPETDDIDDRMMEWIRIVERTVLSLANEMMECASLRSVSGKGGKNIFTQFSFFKINLFKITRRDIHE